MKKTRVRAAMILGPVALLLTALMLSGCGSPDGSDPIWISPSTGMEFIWIPELGMWVGKYEATNGEYREKEPWHDSGNFEGFSLNGDRQPVILEFDEARLFAEWMTQQDMLVLPEGFRYRIPSEAEWMIFAQCWDGRKYPWGDNWPPVSGYAGNYADETAGELLGWSNVNIITGYDDGNAVTAPVEQSWMNEWGLYGVGGNVWEVCATDSTGEFRSAWRGASWRQNLSGWLECSNRVAHFGTLREGEYGFRLVLAP